MSDQGFEPTQPGAPAVQPGGGALPPAGGGPPSGGYPPEHPPADKRLWIVAAVLAVIAVIVIVLLIQRASDDDSATTTTSTSTTTSTTTSTSTTSTTVASSSSSSTSTTEVPESTTTTTGDTPITAVPALCRQAGSDPADPETAAQAVFIAWTRGDNACAAELMTDEARTELFSRNGAGAQDNFQGCRDSEDGDPFSDCAFTYEGGSTHYLMNFSPTDGWQVFDVNQVAD